jgi:hypothetical protein
MNFFKRKNGAAAAQENGGSPVPGVQYSSQARRPQAPLNTFQQYDMSLQLLPLNFGQQAL